MTLADIEKWLEEAEGAYRELDQMLHEELVGLKMYESFFTRSNDVCIRYYPGPPGPEYRALPHYTASIDAALALVEERLPGAEIRICTLYGVADVELPLNIRNHGPFYAERKDGNIAIALLLALIRAEKEAG